MFQFLRQLEVLLHKTLEYTKITTFLFTYFRSLHKYCVLPAFFVFWFKKKLKITK
ncbi:hypothetical protein E2C01_102287 [Portunus trituberculatus]|uniref:Uncharacterized protein n=1 Tax=Portunus trituberculatus TaxID=210409 RepID=A0A5B7KCR8_PORTR|nr:hypothetical protein [Portunus trituberculatus]